MCKSVGNFAENLNLGKRVLPPHVILEDTVKKSTQILTFSYYLTGIHTVSFANLEEPPEELLVRSIDDNFVMELKASIVERGHIGATVLPVLTKDSFDESNPSGSQFYTLGGNHLRQAQSQVDNNQQVQVCDSSVHREIMPLGVAVACSTWCHIGIYQSGERRMSLHLYTLAVGYQIKA